MPTHKQTAKKDPRPALVKSLEKVLVKKKYGTSKEAIMAAIAEVDMKAGSEALKNIGPKMEALLHMLLNASTAEWARNFPMIPLTEAEAQGLASDAIMVSSAGVFDPGNKFAGYRQAGHIRYEGTWHNIGSISSPQMVPQPGAMIVQAKPLPTQDIVALVKAIQDWNAADRTSGKWDHPEKGRWVLVDNTHSPKKPEASDADVAEIAQQALAEYITSGGQSHPVVDFDVKGWADSVGIGGDGQRVDLSQSHTPEWKAQMEAIMLGWNAGPGKLEGGPFWVVLGPDIWELVGTTVAGQTIHNAMMYMAQQLLPTMQSWWADSLAEVKDTQDHADALLASGEKLSDQDGKELAEVLEMLVDKKLTPAEWTVAIGMTPEMYLAPFTSILAMLPYEWQVKCQKLVDTLIQGASASSEAQTPGTPDNLVAEAHMGTNPIDPSGHTSSGISGNDAPEVEAGPTE